MERLWDVSLDVATPAPASLGAVDLNVARGVELCQCPADYAATSCQDPAVGFWRRYTTDYVSSTVIIDLVGLAQPCQCNGRSNVCHIETGRCKVKH